MSTYAPPRSSAAYQQSAILTAPPERLVVMLYDGARRFLHQAAIAMRENRASVASERLRRAEMIIDELRSTLNLEAGGEIASNLQGLYVFFSRHLIEAQIEKDPAKIEWVGAQLGELREAWAQVGAAAA